MSEAGCVQSVSCLLFRGYLLKACKTKHPQSKTRAKTQQPQSRYIANPTKQPTESPTSHQHHLQNNPHAKQQSTITSNISWITSTTEKGEGRRENVNKQQQTALNMARFIKSQSLTLLEKLDALDADEQATLCERLHELAEELCDSVQTHFEAQYGTEP